MAYTVEDIESNIQALEEALATGALSVAFADRSTTYRSVSDLMKAIAYWKGLLAQLRGHSRVSYGVASTGHDC